MADFFTGYIAIGNGSSGFSELASLPGYSRQPVSFSVVISGEVANNPTVKFQGLPGQPSWGAVTQIGLFDDRGNFILWWNPPVSVSQNAFGMLVFTPGSLVVNIQTSGVVRFLSGGSAGFVAGGNIVYAGSTIQVANGVVSSSTFQPNNTLAIMKRLSSQARLNNPQFNAAMTSPPIVTPASKYAASTAYTLAQNVVVVTAGIGFFYVVSVAGTTGSSSAPSGTGNGQVDGGVTWNYVGQAPTNTFQNAAAATGNSYLNSSGTGTLRKVCNLFGGVATDDGVTGGIKMMSVTIAGTLTGNTGRAEFETDSAKFVIRMFDNSLATAVYRLIVNGQFATFTAYQMPKTGLTWLLVDFSAVGGAVIRTVTLEYNSGTSLFLGIDTLTTEGVYLPGGDVPLKAVFFGDSISSSGGVTNLNDNFATKAMDWLGIRNLSNAGIGGTGLMVVTSSGFAITRISDIENSAPDALFIEQGYNDNTFTPAQVQPAMLTLLLAIRARSALANIPIFVFGLIASNHGASWAAGIATENAIFAAVAQLNDALVFTIPCITDPAGSWFFGTGFQGATNGTGNTDRLIAPDQTHPNPAGHTFLGKMFSNAVTKILRAVGSGYSGNW